MKNGEIKEVLNKDRKFGSNQTYYAIHGFIEGEHTPLLLTQAELEISANRGRNNVEDIPKLSLFSRFLNWFN